MRELGPNRFIEPFVDLSKLVQGPRRALRYGKQWRTYRRLGGSAPARELYPRLDDAVPRSPFDPHYFYQDIWAARKVADLGPDRHVDVGSRVDLVGFLTAVTSVVFVDIRPLEARLERLESVAGSIVEMPFEDRAVNSLSCLHVAEHIGLGRYGDPLDPGGTQKAAKELQRVLAVGGQLLFSGPVGAPRTCFNAHRIHSPLQIQEMFSELELVSFAGVDDTGTFHPDLDPGELAGARYACGMFCFTRS